MILKACLQLAGKDIMGWAELNRTRLAALCSFSHLWLFVNALRFSHGFALKNNALKALGLIY